MYIDYGLRMSDKQAITVTTSSTSYVDAIQAGWGQDDEVYARFMVTTAFAGTAGATVTIAIQIAQDTAFGTALTVVSSAIASAKLTAKAIPLVAKLPVAMATGATGGDTLYNPNNLPYRYIRAYYTPVTAYPVASLSITCDLVLSSPLTMDKSL
jgi:hypothetical protein